MPHRAELSGGQLFVEQKGGGQRHEHRRHVVAQGSGGHGGVSVGFKQRDPVEADDRTGKGQQLPVRLDACPPKGCPAEIQQEQQEHCAHRTADKDADGAEGGDGNDEIQLGTVDGLHRNKPLLDKNREILEMDLRQQRQQNIRQQLEGLLQIGLGQTGVVDDQRVSEAGVRYGGIL